jgi:1,4-dihydroxy-6-naphthoate synthase
MPTLHIAISPCPNDTFIFENIYNGSTAIDGLDFRFHFLDIEELNQAALSTKYDIVKVSYALLPLIQAQYTALRSGGAMGFGVGPLLVCKQGNNLPSITDADARVAIPGVHTTANFLLSYLYPHISSAQKQAILFSDIEEAVLSEKVHYGVLIHEGRFTYQQRGLNLVADLGELWQSREQLPIPLGCIVAKTSLGAALHTKLQAAFSASICNYHADGTPRISEFIQIHAQAMSDTVMRQHIDLYVNEFSKDIGDMGEKAIEKMMTVMGKIAK